MNFSHILVPVDFSEASERALTLALSLASKTGGRVTLLHVGVMPHFYATEIGLAGPSATLLQQLSREVAQDQRRRLDRLAEERAPEGLVVETVLREGFPPTEVLAQVESDGHDLVVMGTSGRTGVQRALLGSVTERVVRECPVPVMVTH